MPSDDLEDNHWHREKEPKCKNQLDNGPEKPVSLSIWPDLPFVHSVIGAVERSVMTVRTLDRP
jgi:hypothetical protein